MLNNDSDRIQDWTIRNMAPTVNNYSKESRNFTVYLDVGIVDDSGERINHVFINVTSRLVAVLEQGFHNGDIIKCIGNNRTSTEMKALSLNYSRAIGKSAWFSNTRPYYYAEQ